MGTQIPTSTCRRSASVTRMPSAPPAQDPEIPVSCCAASISSSYVGTYGGLSKRISTACSRRLVNGRASDATSGSSGTYIQYNIIHDTPRKGCTSFWDPVRAVHVAACGLISVQRKTERKDRYLNGYFCAERVRRARTGIGGSDDLREQSRDDTRART